jgi:c-di-GMP-related signal transduction protein
MSTRPGTRGTRVFVARQPIFDRAQRVVAYELLFRASDTDSTAHIVDPETATSQVITTSFLQIGLEQVTGGKPAFINFSRHLLLEGTATILPADLTVVEILEDVVPDRAVLEAVIDLKDAGYRLALDDFVHAAGYRELLQLADIVKVDFLLTRSASRRQLVSELLTLGNPSLALLAEKVENHGQFQEARALGFSLFQGYFFSRPVVLARPSLPAAKAHYIRLLREAHGPTLKFRRVEELIKSDVSLTTKLLRYINAAAFPWSREIESVQRALLLLGEDQVRKWLSLVALSELVQGKPEELATASCVRGRFCELLGRRVDIGATELECFLVGSLSLLDAMLDVPLGEVIESLALSDSVRRALLEREGELYHLLELVSSYEKAEWDRAFELCRRLRLPESELPDIYLDTLTWTQRVAGTPV